MSTSDHRGGVGLDLETRHHDIRTVLEQGEVERAWHLCQQLLAEYPGDLTAHALMGDIYATRRQWVEAADWYALAEQMGGGREISERRAAAQQMMRQALGGQATAPVQDLHRRKIVVQATFLAAGLAVAFAVAIALAGLFPRPTPTTSGRSSAPTPEFATPGTVSTAVASAGPGGVASPGQGPRGATTGPSSRATGARGGVTGTSPTPRTPVVISQFMHAPATDEDYLIARAVSALTWPNNVPMAGDVAVMQDPYQAYCVVTFRIPDTIPTTRLYETVLMQSYRVIVAAMSSDASVDGVTVRALYTLRPSRQQEQTVQAFRANTNRKTVVTFTRDYPNPGTQEMLRALYAAPWWNPAVPQG